jgi:hypothetical protein
MVTPAFRREAVAASGRWALCFASDAFACGQRFRIFAVVDDFTRECVRLIADTWILELRGLEQAYRSAMAHHDHRTPQMGA